MGALKLANAPCSWGVLEFDLEGETQDANEVLSQMGASDFQATELGDWGFMPTEANELSTFLREHSMKLAGAFVPVALADSAAHEEGVASALRTAKLLAACGDEAVVVLADDNGSDPIRTARAGRVSPEHGLDSAKWEVFLQGVNRISRAVRESAGLKTVFHHHCAGFVETPAEIEFLLQNTEPDLVGLCLDTGHYAFGGGDPVDALRRYGDRIHHVHFKDCSESVAEQSRTEGWDYFESVRRGVFCELGQGGVDFPAIVDLLKSRRYGGWVVVEQDIIPGMGSGFENAQRNRRYLKSLGV